MSLNLFVLCAILAIACARVPRQELASAKVMEVKFDEWMTQYNKEYDTEEEYSVRLTNFVVNSQTVAILNTQSKVLNSTATFELNLFGDNSVEELKSRFGMQGYVPAQRPGIPVSEPEVQGPTSFDWRTKNRLTPIKDQGQCGSCWAFSCTESIESVYMIAKGVNGNQMPPLAPQEIVDCDHNGAYGCNGGDLPTCFDFVKVDGLEKEASYPYRARDGQCEANKGLAYVHIAGWKYVIAPSDHNENTMANFVAANSPISITVDAQVWSFYRGGVLLASQCGYSIDHAVQAIGYDTTHGYWIVRNSWGAGWGESGYIRLQYGHNTCGLTSEVTVPVL